MIIFLIYLMFNNTRQNFLVVVVRLIGVGSQNAWCKPAWNQPALFFR